MAVMTNKQLVDKVVDIAKNYKTLYVLGCFGAPMTKSNIQRYINHYSYNNRSCVLNATADTFGFDCVNLIKGVLWGWNGNKNAIYGGAVYCSNGVPDIGADTMITKCSGVTTNFSKIEIGEAVWMSGHIGVYIGNGLAVECTPKWDNDVQITAVGNIGAKSGYHTRTWTKHGKLPWVSYTAAEAPIEKPVETTKKTIDQLAQEVIAGKWGAGAERKKKLTDAGYDYDKVQAKVNELMNKATKKSVDEIAKEVIAGKWGNGQTRKELLTDAGYDYYEVQKKVNELLKVSRAIDVILGDIDGDGKITAADARLAMRAAVKLENLTPAQTEAGDVDKDGKITAADARAIIRKAVGLEG